MNKNKRQSNRANEKYYLWICPKCGDITCSDPMRIVFTVCHAGHQVRLSDYVNDDGSREAWITNE